MYGETVTVIPSEWASEMPAAISANSGPRDEVGAMTPVFGLKYRTGLMDTLRNPPLYSDCTVARQTFPPNPVKFCQEFRSNPISGSNPGSKTAGSALAEVVIRTIAQIAAAIIRNF